jgi:hypothetical protein
MVRSILPNPAGSTGVGLSGAPRYQLTGSALPSS